MNLNKTNIVGLAALVWGLAGSAIAQICEPVNLTVKEPIIENVGQLNPGVTGSKLSAAAYDRVIYWVHGLSGSSASWALPSAAVQAGQTTGYPFAAREVRSFRPEYDESNLTTAKVDLHNAIEVKGNAYDDDLNITADRNRHFIIAHSQGGIVSRAATQMIQSNPGSFNKEFGGIVTFGSSHQGAQILNNIDPNGADMLTTFLNGACEDLGGAMIAEKTAGSQSNSLGKSLVWHLVEFDNIREYLDEGCEILTNDVVPLLFLDDFFKGVNNGYQVNDVEITNMNSNAGVYEAGLAKIAFYGQEDRAHGFWRLLDSERKLRNPTINTNAFIYGDNDDEGMLSFVQNSVNRYLARGLLFNLLAVQTGLDDFTIYYDQNVNGEYAIGWLLTRKTAEDIADAYMDGFIWLLTADSQFQFVSGESQHNWVQTGYKCECVLFTNNPQRPLMPLSYAGSSSDFCTDNTNPPLICSPPSPHYELELVQKPGDVIVLSESAKNFPGASHQIRLDNTNHQKLRNATVTGKQLKYLFNGDYDEYFYTQIR